MILPRRKSIAVMTGSVEIGGAAPIVVQSMTNTDTADVGATARQVAEPHRAGPELVRITVDGEEAAAALPPSRDRVAAKGIDVPIVGDFHYNGHGRLSKSPAGPEPLRNTASTPAMSASRRRRTAISG